MYKIRLIISMLCFQSVTLIFIKQTGRRKVITPITKSLIIFSALHNVTGKCLGLSVFIYLLSFCLPVNKICSAKKYKVVLLML